MTICNMTIEGGARAGLIAPDEKTFEYIKDKPRAPKGEALEQAIAYWKTLKSDEGAHFDRVVVLDAANLPPIVSWGSSPEDVVSVQGIVPNPDDIQDETKRASKWRALDYMGLKPGTKITDIAIDRVFIGSCTNGRIEDLRAVAKVVEGKKVASTVSAMIVPGSGLVKEQAEAEGLDKIFKEAGFDWREPGCSMCLAMNDDRLKPGERCASTSNRNFEGRQGFKGRTHTRLACHGGSRCCSGPLRRYPRLPLSATTTELISAARSQAGGFFLCHPLQRQVKPLSSRCHETVTYRPRVSHEHQRIPPQCTARRGRECRCRWAGARGSDPACELECLPANGADRLWSITVMSLTGSIITLPLLFLVPVPGAAAWPYILLSSGLQVGYSLFLVAAYRHGSTRPGLSDRARHRAFAGDAGRLPLLRRGLGPVADAGRAADCDRHHEPVARQDPCGDVVDPLCPDDRAHHRLLFDGDSRGVKLVELPVAYALWVLFFGIMITIAFAITRKGLAIDLKSPLTWKAAGGGVSPCSPMAGGRGLCLCAGGPGHGSARNQRGLRRADRCADAGRAADGPATSRLRDRRGRGNQRQPLICQAVTEASTKKRLRKPEPLINAKSCLLIRQKLRQRQLLQQQRPFQRLRLLPFRRPEPVLLQPFRLPDVPFPRQRRRARVVQLAGAGAGVLDDTSRLAATVAQVVELGATDLTAANDFDAFDERRVDREYALDAFAVGDLANREALVDAGARTSDANAFIGLHAGTVAFLDGDVDAQRVARGEFRELALGFDLGGLFGFQLLNDVHV